MISSSAEKNPCALCEMPANSECPRMPLCEAECGKKVKVACIMAERGLCARMAALGIYPGAEMELLCRGCVRVNGGTLSLGEDISEKILVIPSA